MRLREIFIKGFKSFADPVRLTVSERVTVVVGPNGSGKSNVVDAIRWVLGEQSMRELRAQERDDVVFWGNEKRPPAQTAYVELTFDDGSQRVTIARELSRDGKSRYLLNSDVVRLRDIRDFLMARGLGKTPYSIVGQGEIDKIVSASPENLRMMIEEIAGVGIYREKKREALAKLEATQQNLTRISDLLFEIDKNRKSLYLKAKRAERYVEYARELEETKKRFYGGLFKLETQRMSDLSRYRDELATSVKVKLKELAQLEMTWSSLRDEFNQIDEEMESYTRTLEEFKKRESQLLEVRERFARKLSELEGKYIESTTRIDMLSDEAKSLRNREEEIKLIVAKLTEEIQEQETTLMSLEREKGEIFRLYTEQEKEILRKKQEFEELERTLSKLHNEVHRLEESNQDILHRLELIRGQRAQKELRCGELEEEIGDLERHILEIAERENELARELETLKSALEEYSRSKDKKAFELDQVIRREKEARAEAEVIRRQIADYQGFSVSVRRIFENRDLFSGLIDVVANLVDFERSLSVAYETLLGSAVQHVVVRTADDAKRIIEFLKAGEFGRATFIPLDLIEHNFQPIHGVEREKGFVGYAAHLVSVPKEYEKLANYLFGNDVIVDNIDNAVALKRKYDLRSRIVTLDGELISGRGAISGGRSRDEYSNSIIARKVRLKTIEETLRQLEEQRQLLATELDVITKEIRNLQDHMDLVREELANVVGRSVSSKRVLDELQRSLRDLQGELNDLVKLESEYTAKYEGNRARIELLSNEIADLDVKRKGLQQEVASFSKELDAHRKRLEQLNEHIATVRAELKSLSERRLQYKGESDRIKLRIEEINEEIATTGKQIKELEGDIERTRTFLVENEREIETLRRTSHEIFASLKDRRTGKDEKLQKLQQTEEAIRRTKEEIETLKERIHETEMRIQEADFRISTVPEEYRVESHVEPEELDTLSNRIKELEGKIKMLGPVDVTAVEEFRKVDEEYNELMKQKVDLEEGKRKLEELIVDTDNQARELFLSTFNKINSFFKKHVENLFYGGTGSMRVLDDGDILESGIEIVISKAGRRVQKLQLLSGGEKALVGIALIMSMLEVNKGIFYVLDEVDAPLDDYNSEKFRRLLEVENSQFIIITHNKLIMEAGDMVHGVTMVDGVSKVIQVKMEEVMV